MVQFAPIRRAEQAITIRPRPVVGGDAHEHHLASVGLRIGEDDTAVKRFFRALQRRAESDHAAAKISSS